MLKKEELLRHGRARKSPNAPEPAPRDGVGIAVWDLVVKDMRERDRMGARKYGRRLRARDGRDGLVDAYQEALDLAVYLRKRIEEERLACDMLKRLTRVAVPSRPKTAHAATASACGRSTASGSATHAGSRRRSENN